MCMRRKKKKTMAVEATEFPSKLSVFLKFPHVTERQVVLRLQKKTTRFQVCVDPQNRRNFYSKTLSVKTDEDGEMSASS